MDNSGRMMRRVCCYDASRKCGGQFDFEELRSWLECTVSAVTRREISAPLDTQTHTQVQQAALDQRAAVLFGRLASDPFRAAHTGASCNAQPAISLY